MSGYRQGCKNSFLLPHPLITLLCFPVAASGKGTRRRFDALHKFSSLCFGLAYFFFRLVLFPALLVWFASDLWHYPSETLQAMSVFELVLYPVATAMIFSLSVIWAVPVARGIWRALHHLVEEEVKSP